MAAPRVTLRLIKRKKQSMYQLDYSGNGKRLPPTVGSYKKDAEFVRAKIQSDLILDKHGILTSTQSPSQVALGVSRTQKLLERAFACRARMGDANLLCEPLLTLPCEKNDQRTPPCIIGNIKS